MKIRLEKYKQKELILLAKKNKTWKELAWSLGVNEAYLSRDLKNEKVLISSQVYNKLCKLNEKRFDSFIVEILEDNWGKSKGGKNSNGSTKKLKAFDFDFKLAEFVGAVLGDGHIFYHKSQNVGVYGIRIAGDIKLDKDYHTNYLLNLGKDIFGIDGKILLRIKEKNSGRFLDFYSKHLVEIFKEMLIFPGNKIKNQSTIPKWIILNETFLKHCLRGLIDTDGSIFKMLNKDNNILRIGFTSHNLTLLNDVRSSFIRLGFHPSKIISNRQIFLSRKSDITKYLKDIGFSNKRHLDRLKNLAPSSSGQR